MAYGGQHSTTPTPPPHLPPSQRTPSPVRSRTLPRSRRAHRSWVSLRDEIPGRLKVCHKTIPQELPDTVQSDDRGTTFFTSGIPQKVRGCPHLGRGGHTTRPEQSGSVLSRAPLSFVGMGAVGRGASHV